MAIEIKIPSVGESITEVTLAAWLVEDGAQVEEDQAIAEIESDKSTMELTAPSAGIVRIKVPEGTDIRVGEVVAILEPIGEAKSAEKPETPERDSAAVVETATIASPAAAKILREYNIPLEEVQGTGKDGRITKADALRAIRKREVATKSEEQQEAIKEEQPVPTMPSQQEQVTTEERAPTVSVSADRVVRRKKMSRIRRTIAEHLVEAKNRTAMLTTFNEADMSAIIGLRSQFKEKFKEKYGVSLGFMGFFIKACAQALMEFPEVNARLEGDEIVYHDYVDLSVAVAAPKGLVTPVIRNAHVLNIAEIERQVKYLAERARENKIQVEELEGGTFTVSNGGVFGSLLSTPILNLPQTAILGMHRIQERPVVVDGEIVVRPMMYLALSYDHRLIDGKEAVSFLVRVVELVENPVRIWLGI